MAKTTRARQETRTANAAQSKAAEGVALATAAGGLALGAVQLDQVTTTGPEGIRSGSTFDADQIDGLSREDNATDAEAAAQADAGVSDAVVQGLPEATGSADVATAAAPAQVAQVVPTAAAVLESVGQQNPEQTTKDHSPGDAVAAKSGAAKSSDDHAARADGTTPEVTGPVAHGAGSAPADAVDPTPAIGEHVVSGSGIAAGLGSGVAGGISPITDLAGQIAAQIVSTAGKLAEHVGSQGWTSSIADEISQDILQAVNTALSGVVSAAPSPIGGGALAPQLSAVDQLSDGIKDTVGAALAPVNDLADMPAAIIDSVTDVAPSVAQITDTVENAVGLSLDLSPLDDIGNVLFGDAALPEPQGTHPSIEAVAAPVAAILSDALSPGSNAVGEPSVADISTLVSDVLGRALPDTSADALQAVSTPNTGTAAVVLDNVGSDPEQVQPPDTYVAGQFQPAVEAGLGTDIATAIAPSIATNVVTGGPVADDIVPGFATPPNPATGVGIAAPVVSGVSDATRAVEVVSLLSGRSSGPTQDPVISPSAAVHDPPAAILGGEDKSDGGLLSHLFYDDGAADQVPAGPDPGFASQTSLLPSLGFIGQSIDAAELPAGMSGGTSAFHLA